MTTNKYLDEVGLIELVKKSKEAFTNASLKGEDGGTATIRNYTSGGMIAYRPETGKASFVSVDSGTSSAAGAKVMMRVQDNATKDGHILYGNDTGFYYHKGTSIAPDALDEVLTKREVTDMVTTGDIADMATKTEVAEEYATKDQVQSDIKAAKEEVAEQTKTLITGTYTPKGSSTLAELPDPSEENLGSVYNMSEQFTTDNKFNTPGESFPAGTNVVVVEDPEGTYKYDVFSGEVDLSGYLQEADITSITNEEIDALFA